jgi:hypothetical protein
MRVPTMSDQTMQERMQQEQDEMLTTLNLANSALMRIFGIGEEDDE